jgi:hypothetical protein
MSCEFHESFILNTTKHQSTFGATGTSLTAAFGAIMTTPWEQTSSIA